MFRKVYTIKISILTYEKNYGHYLNIRLAFLVKSEINKDKVKSL